MRLRGKPCFPPAELTTRVSLERSLTSKPNVSQILFGSCPSGVRFESPNSRGVLLLFLVFFIRLSTASEK